MFWDREDELAFLDREYRQATSNLVVIYGRRRVGKTRLIQEFLKDKPAIYFLADQQLEVEQHRRFQAALGHFLADPLVSQLEFRDWDTLFRYLEQRADWSRKVVLVLDEFQYLARTNPAFPSILQRLWDEGLKERNICLILCGSLLGMMYRTTLSYQSPLYGRRTGQIRLRPLSFGDYAVCFPHLSFNERVAYYSVTGGVPRYVEAFIGPADLLAQIEANVLDRYGLLYHEPRFILSEEVTETTTYFSLLKTIAQGEHRLGKIAGRLQTPASRLSKYLSTLAELDLVERRVPVTETQPDKSKRGRYTITDPFFRFWFRYVFPNQGDLEVGHLEPVQLQLRDDFNRYLSLAFEDCCRQFLWDLAQRGELPFRLQKIGGWWVKDAEIDIVALHEERREIVFAECKWSRRKVGTNILEDLQKKARRVPWQSHDRQEYFVLFSREGFTDNLIQVARRSDVILLSNGQRFA